MSQLWYGAKSLAETFKNILAPSFYELNPNMVNPMLFPVFNQAKDFLLAALCVTCLWRLAAIALDRSRPKKHGWLLAFGGISAGTFLMTSVLHRLGYALIRLLMPLERTGLFLVSAVSTYGRAVAAVRVDTPAGRYSSRAATAVLLALACYFIFCLVLSYFREWKFDADVRRAYFVVAYYNQRYGVRDISSDWRYTGALNYYRHQFGGGTMQPVEGLPGEADARYPTDRPAYVFYFPDADAFIQQQGLKVVYRSD